VLVSKQTRSVSLNWNQLDYPVFDLVELDRDIAEEEIKSAINEMPKENVSGPDGFIGAFYQKCWDIVKGDVTVAVLHLSQLRGSTFNLLNAAHIVLFPKKE
jgi:hypothetical protein